MNILKRTISYSPYLLVLLVVVPFFAQAQGTGFLKEMMWVFVNNVFGTLIGWAGVLLDYAVNNYVIGFGATWGINSVGVGGAVDMMWVIVRDIFNITFIFGLVWLGFKMILRRDDANTRRTLITLILAALLINFSLFITKFVVDFTNILATQIALAFVIEGTPADGAQVSHAFMQLFGLTGIWESATPGDGELPAGSSWMYIFGTAIIFMIGAFTFAAGAIMLIIRFAALCIYMVFSPILFLGMVFPGLKSISNNYLSGFLGRAFYAPAYLMLVYLAAFVMGSYNESASGFAAAAGNSSFNGSTFGSSPVTIGDTLGPFALTCIFLIASVVVAGKMSTTGASTTIGLGNNIRGRLQRGARNTAVGTGRFTARQTAGRVARGVSNASERTRRSLDRGLSTRAQGGGMSRAIARGLDRTVGSGLRAAENASVAGSETKAQQRKRVNEQNARLNAVRQETDRSNTVIQELARARANTGDNPEERANRTAAMNAVNNQVRRMSDKEILDLAQQDQELLQSPEFAQHLTDSHIKALRESGQYTNEEGRAISTTRDTGMIATASEALDSTNASAVELNAAFDQLAQNIQSMSVERLSGMDVGTLSNQRVASNLTETQLEGMRKSGRFTAAQITEITTSRGTGLGAIANGNAPEIINSANPDRGDVMRSRGERLFQGSAQAAGQLPVSVYTEENSASLITPSALSQRVRNGLSNDDARAIQTNIQNYLDRAANDREKNVWKKWTENSTEGSRFNFTVNYD